MNYADIINVTESSVLFSYELENAGFAVLSVEGTEYKSVEATGTGRFEITGLEPLHAYHAELSGVSLDFTTLPAPEGKELGRFALISDPHVSLKDENRKGRFFIESAAIMREALENAADLGRNLPLFREMSPTKERQKSTIIAKNFWITPLFRSI